VCQLFGVVVEQIPGFAAYKPRGGWSETPSTLVTQRETAAYHLLFGDAIAKNNNGAKRAFAQMFGGGVTVTSTSSTVARKTSSTIPTKPVAAAPKKQSLLDSMFMDTIKLQAAKAATKANKKAAEETSVEGGADVDVPKKPAAGRKKAQGSA
jgi:hypothetical protein